MVTPPEKQLSDKKRESWILYSVLMVLTGVFTWLYVKPELIYQAQEPVFFWTSRFFREHFQYPGGLTVWAGRLLGQTLYFNWMGAVVLTLIHWLTALSFWAVLKAVFKKNINPVWVLIPVLAFFVLQNQYDYTLAYGCALLKTAAFSALFLLFAPGKGWFRWPVYGLLAFWLYVSSGGAFFLFVVLAGLYEMIHMKQIISGLLMMVYGWLLVQAGFHWLYFVDFETAVYHLSPADMLPGLTRNVLTCLYLYLPLAAVIHFAGQKLWEKWSLRLLNKRWSTLLCAAFFVLFGLLLGIKTTDPVEKQFLTLANYAQNKDWISVYKSGKQADHQDWRLSVLMNQALFHTSSLAEKMFNTPQIYGLRGLIMEKKTGLHYPLQYCSFYADLGHLNEAEHWGHESMSVHGETGWTLEKLALVNLGKGEMDAAHVFISRLEQTLLFRKRAAHFRQLHSNPELLLQDSEVVRLKSNALRSEDNFIYYASYPTVTFDRILKHAPRNRMAFEYLMSMYLLTGDLNGFVKHLKYLPVLGYTSIPKHFQEAIILYMTASKSKRLPLPRGFNLDSEYVQRFRAFQTTLSKFRKDKKVAYSKLKSTHEDTYWFYLQFYKPKES